MRKLRILFVMALMNCTVDSAISIEENPMRAFADNEVRRFQRCAQENGMMNPELGEFREHLIHSLESVADRETFQAGKRHDILVMPGITDTLKVVAGKFSEYNESGPVESIIECYINDMEAESDFYRKIKVDHGVYILNQYVPLTCAQRNRLEKNGYCVDREMGRLVHWSTNIIHTHVGSILPIIINSEVRDMLEPEQNEMVHLLGRSTASSGLQLFLPVTNFDEVSLTYHISSIIPEGGIDQVDGLYFDIIGQLFSTYAGLWEREFGLSEDWGRRFELVGLQAYRQFAFRMSDPQTRLQAGGVDWVSDVNMPFTHVLLKQPLWMKMVEKCSAFLIENGADPADTPVHELKDYMDLCGRMNIYHVLHEVVPLDGDDGAAEFISGRQLNQLYEVFSEKLASGDLEKSVGGFPDSRFQRDLLKSCRSRVNAILSHHPGNLNHGDVQADP